MTDDVVDYRERVARDVPPIERPEYERYSGLYVFLSLDLVNSTAYKAKNPDWKFLIRMFYDEARDFWRNHQGSFLPSVWKFAGDEVLFYSRIGSVSELAEAVETSAAAVRYVNQTTETWSQKTSPRLFVKGTCWSAYVDYQPPAPVSSLPTGEAQARNIVFETPFSSSGGAVSLDFLGPEIDAGFRITSAAAKKALVVSAEASYLLRERGERRIGDRLRIVGYRELKGVWEGRHYPIVWYREKWEQDALDTDYAYDDRFRIPALEGAYSASKTSGDALSSVLGQVGARAWLDALDLPAEPAGVTEPDSATLTATESEVHAVAVCFSDDGKVLVAKRPVTKEVMPGAWEAGCAKLRPGEHFFQAMKRDYLADFSIELDFEPFGNWGTVGTYSFIKREHVVPGVIFVARVVNVNSLTPAKHIEVRWVDPANLPAEVASECVPELDLRLLKALDLWRASSAGKKHLSASAPE